MSDGNFNRNLLPCNSYQSGFRAGHARMKQQALDAFESILKSHLSHLISEDIQKDLSQYFRKEINQNNP